MSKSVVITGSTRGIGHGLAQEFLARGCRVFITGRSAEAVAGVVSELGAKHGADNVAGRAGDVSNNDDLQAQWDEAVAAFGGVDIWINNAGVSAPRKPFWELEPETYRAVIDANVYGLMLANRIAIRGMLAQGHGQVWNMQGFGSNGRSAAGMVTYGASKAALQYLTEGLQKDTKDLPVQVCFLSPGIVVTDLLKGDYDGDVEAWEKARKIFNILGDKVEVVTPFLVEGILASNKQGAEVNWLTTPKVLKKFLGSMFKKRELFND